MWICPDTYRHTCIQAQTMTPFKVVALTTCWHCCKGVQETPFRVGCRRHPEGCVPCCVVPGRRLEQRHPSHHTHSVLCLAGGSRNVRPLSRPESGSLASRVGLLGHCLIQKKPWEDEMMNLQVFSPLQEKSYDNYNLQRCFFVVKVLYAYYHSGIHNCLVLRPITKSVHKHHSLQPKAENKWLNIPVLFAEFWLLWWLFLFPTFSTILIDNDQLSGTKGADAHTSFGYLTPIQTYVHTIF